MGWLRKMMGNYGDWEAILMEALAEEGIRAEISITSTRHYSTPIGAPTIAVTIVLASGN